MKRTGDPNDDRITLSIAGRARDIPVTVTDVNGLTSYRIPLDLGALGDHTITLDLFHPEPATEPTQLADTGHTVTERSWLAGVILRHEWRAGRTDYRGGCSCPEYEDVVMSRPDHADHVAEMVYRYPEER